MKTPEWVKHAVFYQIFPDRFARSRRITHPRGIRFKPWGSPPKEQGFQGGDLLGIVDKLEYLQELGVTALYLNPIFASASNHRYHTYDYFQVDPLLGGNQALAELLQAAHGVGLRVVLDGVFNHASRGFWAFHHILENGEQSPYLDWFTVRGWPLRPYSSTPRRPANYDAWWGLPALPKLNIRNPGVREHLLSVARYWVEEGIDGWRLDVPDEIKSPSFWRQFRREVKAANPEAYICGEIWEAAPSWLKGDKFDAVMNYPFCAAALSFCGAETLRDYRKPQLPLAPIRAAAFGRQVDRMMQRYHWEVTQVQLNLLDSHDTARALWIMGEDKSALRLCVLLQMTLPGAPCIYYGDEIGLSAGDDPDCRQAFPWRRRRSWDRGLLDFYRQAIALRHRCKVLRTGSFKRLYARGSVYAFRRLLGRNEALVAFNCGRREAGLRLPLETFEGAPFRQVWPQPETQLEVRHTRGSAQLRLPPREAMVVVRP